MCKQEKGSDLIDSSVYIFTLSLEVLNSVELNKACSLGYIVETTRVRTCVQEYHETGYTKNRFSPPALC